MNYREFLILYSHTPFSLPRFARIFYCNDHHHHLYCLDRPKSRCCCCCCSLFFFFNSFIHSIHYLSCYKYTFFQSKNNDNVLLLSMCISGIIHYVYTVYQKKRVENYIECPFIRMYVYRFISFHSIPCIAIEYLFFFGAANVPNRIDVI